MPKILKDSKKAVQTRNRVRMLRGIRSIMKEDSTPHVNVNSLKSELKSVSKANARFTSSKQLPNLTHDLRTWAIEKNINKRAVSALLKILRSNGINIVPKDSRTLLATPKSVQIINLAGGMI